MSKGVKIITAIIAAILVIALVAFGLWSWFSRQAFPQTSGEISVAGLQEEVEIIRDEYGVAQCGRIWYIGLGECGKIY